MNGHRIGYTRVSTVDQNTARQLDGVQVAKVFTDKASGKDAKRPQLEAMLAFVREGDTVIVHSMDRLARNLDDLRRMGLPRAWLMVAETVAGVPTGTAKPAVSTVTLVLAHLRPWLASAWVPLTVARVWASPAVREMDAARAAFDWILLDAPAGVGALFGTAV